MVRVYVSPNPEMVHLAKNVLESSGIECVIRGEHLAAVVGGGAGIEAWVELWVVSEAESATALEVIGQILEEEKPAGSEHPWICPDCIEWREGQYSHCWKCGAERLDP